MILADRGSLHILTGGVTVKARVQHPQVKPRKDRLGWPWAFRYLADEPQPEGSGQELRKYQEARPSKGSDAHTQKAVGREGAAGWGEEEVGFLTRRRAGVGGGRGGEAPPARRNSERSITSTSAASSRLTRPRACSPAWKTPFD